LARGDARPTSQKSTKRFFGILTPDADDENRNISFARDGFLKRRGFFFQCKTNERQIWGIILQILDS
jgi:hypothetical protein